jgi:antitoxin component HigA of HigAB toxin-antitoxin module
MMSNAVINPPYDFCTDNARGNTKQDIAAAYESAHSDAMLGTEDLLSRLDALGIKNVQIAKALGLPESRASDIRARRRALKLDEAVKLVRAFQLEEAREVPPVPLPIMRLVARHIAERLQARASEAILEDVAQDLRAFGVFLADRRVRSSLEAAEGFFQALRYRRPGVEEEAPQGNDPHHAH